MKRLIFLFITIFIGSLLFAQQTPYVYNVTGTQRTDGSKIVDIYYNVLDPDGDTLFVSLQVSADDGNTYDIIPADSLLSGDIGEGILTGNGKHIIWQAGEEETLTFEGTTYKFKVIANDTPAGFVFVEGGTFSMGDHYSEDGNAELPLHDVTLSSFYIQETEVTQSEYEAIMGSNPAYSHGVRDNYPVYYVNWYSAIKYCNKKSIIEGLTPCYSVDGDTNPDNWGTSFTPDVNWNANAYRLPTEAEWEYAARGGIHHTDDYRFSGCHNEADLPDYAWYNVNNSPKGTKEVGTKLPNQLGLYDMSGNVFELCWDWYDSTYYSSSPSSNPHGANSGPGRVVRGGYYVGYVYFCRAAHRYYYNPSHSSNIVGFRVCRSVE